MTEKVKFEKIVNATVRVTNEPDTSKEFVISADVTINNKNADNFNSGNVNKADGGATVATFSSWGESNLNVNYNLADVDENVKILNAIYAFIDDVRSKAAETESFKIQ